MLWQQNDQCRAARKNVSGRSGKSGGKEFINELNVFPVPDGDTLTNMTLTIMSAAKEVSAMEAGYGISGKSDFFPVLFEEPEETRGNPFSASEKVYKRQSGRKV